MEKTINILFTKEKDIVISMENGQSIIIHKDNRTISADDLYNLIDFSRGDKYIINKLSETGDASYKFFVELVEDIISKINKMPDKINDAFINN